VSKEKGKRRSISCRDSLALLFCLPGCGGGDKEGKENTRGKAVARRGGKGGKKRGEGRDLSYATHSNFISSSRCSVKAKGERGEAGRQTTRKKKERKKKRGKEGERGAKTIPSPAFSLLPIKAKKKGGKA